MMIGEFPRSHPTVQIPHQYWDDPYDFFSDPTLHHHTLSPPTTNSLTHNHHHSAEHLSPSSPSAAAYAAALNRHLSSPSPTSSDTDPSSPVPGPYEYDTFPSDDFRMYEFKVRRCPRLRSHDWTDCPFVHPGEKARRRDPRVFRYSSSPCPDYRASNCSSCPAGDSCPLAHGVFESWLHPSRYRTQPCKDAVRCSRRVCFFAHTIDQLRLVVPEVDGSKTISTAAAADSTAAAVSTPPSGRRRRSCSGGGGVDSVSELVRAMSGLRMGGGGCVGNVAVSPSRRLELQSTTLGCSPRSAFGAGTVLGGGCSSSPSTPAGRSGVVAGSSGLFDAWMSSSTNSLSYEAATEVAERVESGRDVRERMYSKLMRENSLARAGVVEPVPDFGWVKELVK